MGALGEAIKSDNTEDADRKNLMYALYKNTGLR
jgi:hypothetical protein